MSGDTAHVLVVSSHLDVSSITPTFTPAVLHDVEVLLVLGALETVANCSDSVVEVGRAAHGLIVDSVRVELERVLKLYKMMYFIGAFNDFFSYIYLAGVDRN